LFAGIALPFLGLAIANRASAFFREATSLRVARIAVIITPNDVLERVGAPGTLLTVQPAEFDNVPAPETRARDLNAKGLKLRTRVPALPILAPYGEASAARAALGPKGARTRAGLDVALVPLQLAGEWVF